ncbi:MAG: esterase family protein [Phycisphaerales bacterium]|nr:esterase family protein [Phycisphaerales bacterium]
MSLAHIQFFGNAIGMATTMNVLLPDASLGPFPVFYLLHGLSDDCSSWLRRTSLERYMAGIPMMVVMPGNARGFYTNSATQPINAYEDHIIKDVIAYIDRVFPTIKSRNGRVLGGLSMGGYGAVKLALKHPDLFCSAVSHSGAVMTPLHKPETRPQQLQSLSVEFESILGKDWRGSTNDPVALAKQCPPAQRPALRLDCGTSDFLLEQNREFHAILNDLKFPHEYEEFPGDHNWAYWDVHIRDAIAFHCKVLGI